MVFHREGLQPLYYSNTTLSYLGPVGKDQSTSDQLSDEDDEDDDEILRKYNRKIIWKIKNDLMQPKTKRSIPSITSTFSMES